MIRKIYKTTRFVLELKSRYPLIRSPKKKSEWMVDQIQGLGPTYVKIGQFLSSRSDIFGKDDLDALKSLQDSVSPMKWNEILRVIESSGLDLDAFFSIDEVPLASASIGQVHKAVLKNGEVVVIKVKRPNISQNFEDDIKIIETLVGFAPAKDGRVEDTRKIISDLKKIIIRETDFVAEVANMLLMRRLYPMAKSPNPIASLCSQDVIVMTFIPSSKFKNVKASRRKEVAYKLMDFFINQFLQTGLIHGDPHEGNVAMSIEDDDGNDFVMYDLGHIIQLDQRLRSQMKILVFELMTDNVDGVISIIETMPEIIEIKDRGSVRAYVENYIKYIKTIDLGVFNNESFKNGDMPIRFSSTVFEIIRVFGIIEGVCLSLDPDFKYDTVFYKYVDTLILDRDFLNYKAKKDMGMFMNWF